jgi:DNA-directed RNA polymerase subunit RPC12/RpoP
MRPNRAEPAQVGYRCEFCGRVFPLTRDLEAHVAAEHMGRPYAPRCTACGRTFESPADLKAHNQAVHGAPPG